MSIQSLLFILAILLLGLFCLTSITIAFRRLQRKDTKKQLNLIGKRFFYRYLSQVFFPKQEYEDLYFSGLFTQNMIRFCYAIVCLLMLGQMEMIHWEIGPEGSSLALNWPSGFLLLIGLFFLLFIIGEYLARLVGNRYPEHALSLGSPIASFFMTLLFPFTFIFLKIFQLFPHTFHFEPSHEPNQEAKQELIDIIEESNLNTHFDPQDKKILESVMGFKERIAREIMVPRVDIFSLPHHTTIEEATNLIYKEGYSRIPVYQDTLDNIIGVLMYKDVLAKYMEHAREGNKAVLQSPIYTIIKDVIYAPETKKISHLLQEFRKKQVHLAIIVDEYGGTEGIVTIEDILEEIVGEIADEYDQEEALFLSLPEGGWLIDARMAMSDVETELGIEFPEEGDYDTVGGYVFHETGMIPPKGYLIQKPNFELEVIRSNNRRVEKVRIKPIP